jgi:ribosomal-protein-alanine N-acetyltransferase
MKAPSTIETPRLILRRPDAGDAPAMFSRYAGDPVVTRYLGWPTHQTVDDTRAFLSFSDAEWEHWPAGPYLICSRANGDILGGTGFGFETPHRASTGYVLAQDAWGQGYATETLRAIVKTAHPTGIQRLFALCHPDHRPSRRVLEKCDFQLEGTLRRHTEFPNMLRGVVVDVLCYVSILEDGFP